MQEEMNKAMAQLRRPSATTCRRSTRCSTRSRRATPRPRRRRELRRRRSRARILEVEQATANVEAQSRLSELRAELGLDSPRAPAVGAAARRRRAAQARRRLTAPSAGRSRNRSAHPVHALVQVSRTRSSRWMTSWATSDGRSLVRLPMIAAQRRRRRSAPCPWRRPRRPSRAPRRLALVEVPSTR